MTHADGIVEPPAGVVLIGDPRVASIPIVESGEPMIDLGTDLSPAQRRNRDLLVMSLTEAGFVNYPTEWWHWSLGDRYWCLVQNGSAARYGTKYLT
jgi:hypothetical protein